MRAVLNLLAGLSLLCFLAASAAWVRSEFALDVGSAFLADEKTQAFANLVVATDGDDGQPSAAACGFANAATRRLNDFCRGTVADPRSRKRQALSVGRCGTGSEIYRLPVARLPSATNVATPAVH